MGDAIEGGGQSPKDLHFGKLPLWRALDLLIRHTTTYRFRNNHGQMGYQETKIPTHCFFFGLAFGRPSRSAPKMRKVAHRHRGIIV